MKFAIQSFLLCLILVKIVLGSIFAYRVELEPLSLECSAMASEEQKSAGEKAEECMYRVDEEKMDLKFLIKKEAELKNEEERIAKKRAEVELMQKEINHKIEALTRLRNEIRTEITKKKTIGEQKLKHLIKAYSAMKPQKAAALIEKLDVDFAIELLANMKGEMVGDILSFIDIEKAARISEGLVKRH